MSIPFSKRWRTARKYNDIIDKAVTTFDAQYKLLKMQGKIIETEKGINKRALGYLHMFLHCALRAKHLDVTTDHAVAVYVVVFEKLWGAEAAKRYQRCLATATDDDEEIMRGHHRAVMDYEYCSQTGNQPMGWFACFRNSDEFGFEIAAGPASKP